MNAGQGFVFPSYHDGLAIVYTPALVCESVRTWLPDSDTVFYVALSAGGAGMRACAAFVSASANATASRGAARGERPHPGASLHARWALSHGARGPHAT